MSANTTSIEKTCPGSLSSARVPMSVAGLERFLLSAFPAEDACSWDRTGLLVGDPAATVEGVAIALDPTIPALEQAHAVGANVLLTHHPVFLDAPERFVPAAQQGHTPGAVVRAAIERGMSIVSFHTALDVSREGLDALPALLRLDPVGVLEPLAHDVGKGLGRICAPNPDEPSLTLRHLSARCVATLGSLPRVWGAPERELSRIVCSGGSASGMAQTCLSQGIECLVCGEMKYHEALDASLSGLAIIELGHDVSEFPLCVLLAAKCVEAGVPETCITMISQEGKWYTPESSRR